MPLSSEILFCFWVFFFFSKWCLEIIFLGIPGVDRCLSVFVLIFCLLVLWDQQLPYIIGWWKKLGCSWNQQFPIVRTSFFHAKQLWFVQCILSVQFSHSVVSNSLWPHEPQHTRPPCPSQTPWVYSNTCPLSQWCHPAISSSVFRFSSCLQSFPAPGSFSMS